MYRSELLDIDRQIKRAFHSWAREDQKAARYHRLRVERGLRPIASGIVRLRREWERMPARRLFRAKLDLPEWLIGRTVAVFDTRGYIIGTSLRASEVVGFEFRFETLAFTLRKDGDRLIVHSARYET